jgi:hypothetical protein
MGKAHGLSPFLGIFSIWLQIIIFYVDWEPPTPTTLWYQNHFVSHTINMP